ncbi:MAG: hypothetical protein ACRD5I_17020 [Candidatus Acidiferrales bacterium]
MRAHRLVAVAVLAGVVLLAPTAARAQRSSADDAAVQKLYDDFFEAMRQGGPSAAVATLRQSGSLDPQKAQAMERRLQNTKFPAGRVDSYTVVSEMEIPGSFRFRSILFLTHHETGAVAWRLRFYQKPAGVWVIINVDFETEFVEDFLRLPEIQFESFRALLRLPGALEEGRRNR